MAGLRPLSNQKTHEFDSPGPGVKRVDYKTGAVFFSLGMILLVLSIGPALGQQELKEVNELNRKVEKFSQAGKYAEAIPLAQRALELREQALEATHPGVAQSLNILAELYRNQGQYARAEPLFKRSLAIYEKAFGPNHLYVAASLNNLAELHRNQGQYALAEPLSKRSLAIYENALGPNHPSVAVSLNNLAAVLRDAGDYGGARPLYERGLKINEEALGPTHPDVAMSLNNLALLLQDTGDYVRAQMLYERALKINEHALGPMHPTVALSLNNLAFLLNATGDYARARPLMERALRIHEQTLGPTHPSVAVSLNNLAYLLSAMGYYAGARPLYERALRIHEQTLGPMHPSVAVSLNNLALLLDEMGDYAAARPLYERALRITEQALGTTHPDVAGSLNNLAVLLKTMKDYGGARPLYERALKVNEQALGPTNPRVAMSLNNLAGLEAAQRRFGLAAGLYKRASLIQDRHIQNVFNITTEAEKLIFIESLSGGYQAYLSLVHQHLNADTEVIRDGLELVLRRKGVVFDAQSRAREALKGRLSETARKDFDRLSALRSELARLLLNKPEKMSADIYKEKLNTLQQEIEATERRLAGQSALVAKELQQRTVTVERVSKQLPKNAALAEFVKIRDVDFANREGKSSWRYLAFVLTSTGDVTLVDLGEADALEVLAARVSEDLRLSVKSGGSQPIHLQKSLGSLRELYTQLWTPLQKSLGRADKVLLSPDGILNLVPFATLMDADGRPLVERYQIAYVSSGRELVGADATAHKPDSDLLLVANPAFDLNAQKVTASVTVPSPMRSRDFRGHFGPLPGTDREASDIPPLVAGDQKRKQVVVGPQATEGAVKTARSPRILHLATHGFFLQDEAAQPDLDTRGGLLQTGRSRQPRTAATRYENPLLRSGLAFAGANNASQVTEGDDGLLTALEITGMDLYGTELVVLSACETAVGEVKTGEGVFGLRRAFALAGAKNLMMSLWPVSDDITADQMKAFYQNLQKMPPAEALRQAQLQTIKELKAEFDGIAPPALWAPFILQGAQALGQ